MRKQLFGWILFSLAASQVSGDATVTRSLKLTPASGQGVMEARHLQQIHGLASRRETDAVLDGTLLDSFQPSRKSIVLISLEKDRVHRLEFPQTSFEEFSLSKWKKASAPKDPYAGSTRRIRHSWSRVLPEEESKTINGFPCTKFVYEWRFETEDSETLDKKQYGVKTTLWLTDITPTIKQIRLEESAFSRVYHERMGGRPLEGLNRLTLHYAGTAIGMNQQALFEELTYGTTRLKQISGYIVASQSDWFLVGFKENKLLFTVESQLESVSATPLMASVFTPTIDYDSVVDLPTGQAGLPDASPHSLTQAK